MASSSEPLSKPSSFAADNGLAAVDLLPYLRQPRTFTVNGFQGQSTRSKTTTSTSISEVRRVSSPSGAMDGLRITYPCISIDFETIVNSLKTVHEDVHWEEDLIQEAPQSVVGGEDKREMDMTELRMELACDLCGDVMRCPCTSVVCLHSYCRSCIEEAVEKQSGEKSCPVEGCEDDDGRPALLGCQPCWNQQPTIVGDGLLAEVIKKLVRGGCDDPDGAAFDRWIPNLLEAEGIEDLGPIRCIRAKQHRSIMATDDSVMDVDRQRSDRSIATPDSTEDDLDDPVYMTVAVFPFEDEGIAEMDDNYFFLPSHMTGRAFREYLENRFSWSLMLYCEERCLTDSVYEAITLEEICDVCWRPSIQQPDDVFTLRYRLDHSRKTESPQ